MPCEFAGKVGAWGKSRAALRARWKKTAADQARLPGDFMKEGE